MTDDSTTSTRTDPEDARGGCGEGDRPAPALVIGLGDRDRGDDAVGVEVARAVDRLELPGVEVATHEDPTNLVTAWSGHGLVVVVDAVSSGAAPGDVIELDIGSGQLGSSEALARTAGWSVGGGTHALGLAAAVELSRALHRLPARLVVVGVEAAGFGHGQALSPEVAAAVPHAVRAVAALVAATPEGPGRGDGGVPG